ncbi:MAG: hypothetical protein E7159_03035 [Firmicutes bacterium]|nr:hypothetical protein [Bacillota bacterium]
MKKRYKVVMATLLILLTLTIGISVSYSMYEKPSSNYSLVESDQYVSINYLDGKFFDIADFKSGDVYSKKVTISNVSNVDTYATLSLMDVSKSSENLILKVIDSEGKVVYEKKITNVDTEIIKGVDLGVGKSLSYTVSIENKGEDTKNFYADILAYKELTKQTNETFKDVILKNNKVKESLTNVGMEAALKNEGLIKTQDDDGEAYFFRGAVDNNNVVFNDVKFKILRINGDSSVRLILSDALESNYAYNNDNSEVDNYADKLKLENSSVKEVLDKWLSANFSNYTKYIGNSTYCEDLNVFKEENNIIYLNTYNRLFVDDSPSLVCAGNKLSAQVGLISADEVVYAGAYRNSINQSFFLYNENLNGPFVTMSGSQILQNYNAVDAIIVNKNGSLSYDKKISNEYQIRPVISLDSNTTVTGSGTINDPYVVKLS